MTFAPKFNRPKFYPPVKIPPFDHFVFPKIKAEFPKQDIRELMVEVEQLEQASLLKGVNLGD